MTSVSELFLESVSGVRKEQSDPTRSPWRPLSDLQREKEHNNSRIATANFSLPEAEIRVMHPSLLNETSNAELSPNRGSGVCARRVLGVRG